MHTPSGALRTELRRVSTLPIARFMGIGVLSTLAYALLFLSFAGPLGSAMANLLALVITAVANTAANRRLTFGIRGGDELLRHHLGGLIMFAMSLGMTDGALAIVHTIDPHPARLLELASLLLASFCATATRYVGMSSWLFKPRRETRRNHPVQSFSTQR
jgi:putative flippase GtrA